MRDNRTRSGRGVATVLGVVALGALTAAPTGTAVAAPVDRSSAAPADTTVVRGEAGLRRAVFRANQTDGRAVIRLGASIEFDTERGRWPGSIGGDLDVRDDLTIVGNGYPINAQQIDRVLDVHGDSRLVLEDVRLRDGAPQTGASGGAIRSVGTVRIVDSVISRSIATGTNASGGAIFNSGGTLTVVRSTLRENDATRAGGAIEALGGTTRVVASTLQGNATGPEPGNGGALHLTGAGTVVVRGSTVSGNFAMAEGGGLWNSADGTFSVVDTTVSGNTAAGAAADQGGGALFNDGGTMTVSGSTISGNNATGAAGSGGGILNNLGALTVSASVLDGNSALRAGGGLESNVGTVTLTDVDLTDNSTGAAPGNGGGLHITGAGTVTYTGGTVTGNAAANEGGGLWNSATGTLVATMIDIMGNTAPTGPDAFNDGGTFTLNGVPVPPG